jgi:hypothetical protein
MGPGSALFGPPSARVASRARTGEHRWLVMAGLVTTAFLVAASAFVLHRAHHERREVGWDRGNPRSTRASYALLVEPLSPELALIDPELAEKARAQLADDRGPARRPAPVRQPEPPPLPCRSPRPARADQGEPVEATRRSRGKSSAIVAAIALAAVLGGAAAAWVRYDDNISSSGETEQPATQQQRGRPPVTATSELGEARTVRSAARSRPKASGGFGPPTPLRPPAFHVQGAPKEPLDEMALPVRARRLDTWLTPGRSPIAANQHHWLYQHAWIVTGAKFGWWHGAEALRVLIRVDRRVESQWGIGYRSEAAARRALAVLEAKAT